MQNRTSVGTSRKDSLSSGRESLSLRSDDIPGAKAKSIAATKNILHYKDRLPEADFGKYQENLQNKQLFNSHDYIFGGELKIGLQKSLPHGKRHYGDHYRSEIADHGGIKRGDPTDNSAQAFDYDRNLNVADIPGALVGSAKSKSLANHDLAQRLKRGTSVQRERPEQSINYYRRVVGDSLDRFQQEVSDSIIRDRRSSNQAIEPRSSSFVQQGGPVEPIKKEILREHTPTGNINQVLNSSALYRNAAGAPTRGRGDSSVNSVSRKGSSQDYTMLYERRESAIQSERKEEPIYRPDDIQHANALKGSSRTTPVSVDMNSLRRKESDQQRSVIEDSSGYRESVLEQAYGKPMNKKDDLKKVYTFNIISNQPNPKLLPTNARLPYRYAIPFDVEQLTSNKRESYQDRQQHNNVERIHNLLLQHNDIGREYNQSMPLGRDSCGGPKH